jgi:hypothetical protein
MTPTELKFMLHLGIAPPVGVAYTCKFKTVTKLDTYGRVWPNLSDVPYGSTGDYNSQGDILVIDSKSKRFKVKDKSSKKEFIVEYNDILQIDEAEVLHD